MGYVNRIVQRTLWLALVIGVAAAVAVAAALAVAGHQPLVIKNASARAHAAAARHTVTVVCPASVAAAKATAPTFTAAMIKCHAKVPAGPRGRRGPRGPRGAAGPAGKGTPFVYRATAGTTTPTTVFSGDGLTLQASCQTYDSGPPNDSTTGGSPRLIATTATNGASIGEVTGEYDQYGNSNTDEKFDVGEQFQVNYADDAPDSVSQAGTFTYVNAAGQVVTGNFLAMGTGVRSNDTAPNDCVIAGSVSAS